MKIVAITSCPTGVAHTYMAANALKKSAAANNVEIKVETQGSDGIGNELTADDIKNADYALFAADKPVENKDRFIGKKIIEVPVTEAVKNSDNLIKNIVSGNIKSYTLEASGDEDLDDLLQTSSRKGIYKHLMAGFSNMLPFIIAGGICIGISFAFGITASNPESPNYNPIAGFFDTIGGGKVGAFSLIIAILSAYIANSVGGKSAFMPGMVAGLLANYYKTGFLGGILAGFVAGYVAILLKKVLKNIPKSISSLKGALLYPLFGLILTCLILWPVFMPIAKLMDLMVQGLNGIGASHKGIIGLYPLSATEHELVHNGYLFIPPSMVFGRYDLFIQLYKPFIDEDDLETLESIEDHEKVFNSAEQNKLLVQSNIYIDPSEAYEVPQLDTLKDRMSNRIDTIKNNMYSLPVLNEVSPKQEMKEAIYFVNDKGERINEPIS